jgi:Flp pilus assembly protein TadD
LAAISAYRDGLQNEPGSVELSVALAALYQNQGQSELAIKQYEELLEKNPRLAVAANNLAVLIGENTVDKEQLNKAAHLVETFKDSGQSSIQDTYAWILIKQGKIAEGFNLLTKVVAASPEVPTFRYHLGVAYYKNGNPGLASSELKQALSLAKTKGDFAENKQAESLLAEIIKSGH